MRFHPKFFPHLKSKAVRTALLKRKSIVHTEMYLVKFRPMRDPKDLPSIEEHPLENYFSE